MSLRILEELNTTMRQGSNSQKLEAAAQALQLVEHASPREQCTTLEAVCQAIGPVLIECQGRAAILKARRMAAR